MVDTKKPGILLDRDGVIIQNRPDYVLQKEDVVFIPGALEAIAKASQLAFPIAVITNQSAVGRGLLDKETADEINRLIASRIRTAGGRLDAVYMCPHHPDDGCNCRKPEPGLIERAAKELGLVLRKSILIGDAASDIEAGHRAGVGRLALVRTGRGATQAEQLPPGRYSNLIHYDGLDQAFAELLQELGK